MRLSDLFTKKVITAWPEETLTAVAHRMNEHNVGAVVVVDGQRPVGILTDRDLAMALGAQGISPHTQVHRVMTRQVQSIPEDMSVFAATKYMRESGVRRLPIVDSEDRLVGIVTLDDMLGCLGRELCNLTEGIRDEMLVK